MFSAKEYDQKIKESVDEDIRDACLEHVHLQQTKMQDGLKACIEGLRHRGENTDKIVNELAGCLESRRGANQLVARGEKVFEGSSYKDQLGISDTCTKALYQGARAWFDSKQYNTAEQAFFALCCIDPEQCAYWIGLGHSCFQNQSYEQAIDAYAMAAGLVTDDVWPHIWAANCFEAMNDTESEKLALTEAIHIQKSLTPPNPDLLQSLEERARRL